MANVYPPKSNYSEDYISAFRGCCASKFLHALENDQVLLAHPPPGMEAPLTIFFKRGSKIGLKCNKGALITSELGGVADETLALDAALGGVLTQVQLLGAPPTLKFGRGKTSKI